MLVTVAVNVQIPAAPSVALFDPAVVGVGELHDAVQPLWHPPGGVADHAKDAGVPFEQATVSPRGAPTVAAPGAGLKLHVNVGVPLQLTVKPAGPPVPFKLVPVTM